MTKKIFAKKHLTHTFMIISLLFLLPFISILPGINTQAAEQTSVFDNPEYTLVTTKNTSISTKANPNETTILIFGHTGCSYTRSTLNSITACNWIKRSDIRVIFADCNFNDQENVTAYEEGYQCPEITFCYSESDSILRMMSEYKKLYDGTSGGKLPMIVLIDKDNKVQNLLSGTKSADEVLTEIKKFTDINEDGSTPPPSGSESGIENFAYGLKTIDNATVSTKADPNKNTVLLFGKTTCSYTKSTLNEIYGSSWIDRQDIRVIFADLQGASLTETKEFAQNYAGKNIIFCHDESMLNFNFALSYLGLYNQTGGTFPFIIYIDKNNKVQCITLGPQTAEDILKEIDKLPINSEVTPPTPTNPDSNQKPDSARTVSDVSGLKTVSSTAKNIKLTWKKVSNATGYIVYQYNNSSKKWVEKAKTNAVTYTIKGLTPGTAYRFAVKAYIQPQNGKQTDSKSYTSLKTATAPNAVTFKVTPKKKKAIIKWNKIKGATGYTVYYKTKAKDPWKKLKNTKGNSYTKNKLKSGKTYLFTVKAYKTYNGKTYTSSFQSKKVKIK